MSNSFFQNAVLVFLLALVAASLVAAWFIRAKVKPGHAEVICLHVNVNFDAYKHKELSDRGVQISTKR